MQAALQRRRQGDKVSPLNQVSGGAPGAPAVPNLAPTTAPQGSAMPRGGGPRRPPTGGTAPLGSTEAELIIKALDNRLRSLSKQEEAGGV